MNDIAIIDNVPCYEKDGTAYLKLEAVARGLGFTETAASGNECVRWRTVRKYLSELGIATSCDGDEIPDFIPENVFYRLAMKAKNEAAEKFQAKVADEIIPAIRKTGSYSTPQHSRRSDRELEAADKRAAAMLLNAKSRVADKLQKLYDRAGVKAEYQAQALSGFYATDGIDLPRIALQGIKASYDKGTIAKKLGVLSNSGNPHALAIGAIISQLDIRPDEVEAVPFQRNGHDGTDNQYTESVVAKVRLWLERNSYPEKIEYGGKKYKVFYKQAC